MCICLSFQIKLCSAEQSQGLQHVCLLSSALLSAPAFWFVCFSQWFVLSSQQACRGHRATLCSQFSPAFTWVLRSLSQMIRLEQKTPLPAERSHQHLTRILKTGISPKKQGAKNRYFPSLQKITLCQVKQEKDLQGNGIHNSYYISLNWALLKH